MSRKVYALIAILVYLLVDLGILVRQRMHGMTLSEGAGWLLIDTGVLAYVLARLYSKVGSQSR